MLFSSLLLYLKILSIYLNILSYVRDVTAMSSSSLGALKQPYSFFVFLLKDTLLKSLDKLENILMKKCVYPWGYIFFMWWWISKHYFEIDLSNILLDEVSSLFLLSKLLIDKACSNILLGEALWPFPSDDLLFIVVDLSNDTFRVHPSIICSNKIG